MHQDKSVKIVFKEISETASVFGPSLIFYVENKTDKDITVQTRDVYINGQAINATFSASTFGGYKVIDLVYLMGSELERYGIDTIESVDLCFHIFETNTYQTLFDTESVRIDCT